MKRYIKSYTATDKKTGKPVDHLNYWNSADAYKKCDSLKSEGYVSKRFKAYKHAWYEIFESDKDIIVVYWGDGNDNYTLPY